MGRKSDHLSSNASRADWPALMIPLLDDPKGKMGDIRGIYSTCLFEVNELAADMIKQAKTFTEQDRHEVNL